LDIDNNNAVDIQFGGTNATTAATARSNLGLAIGTDVLAPNGSGASLTGVSLTAHTHSAYQAADGNLDVVSSPAAWRLFYSNGTSVLSELALGTLGTALISGGSAAAPYWDVVSGTGGGGTILGSVGSTDNSIVRSDGAGTVTVQGSLATISDAGSVNIPVGQTYNINGTAHAHNYQASSANLTTYAGITPSANTQTLLGAADYAAIRTQLSLRPGTDIQAYDADLQAIAGISGNRGDLLYYGVSGWMALPKSTVGYVLKQGASDPVWGAESTSSGISRWDQLQAPTANLNLAQGNYTSTLSSTLNSANSIWTMTNTAVDLTADVSFIDFKYNDDGDSNGYFLRGYDNAGTDLKWSIGPNGAFIGYSYETVQAATGGVFDLLEGSGNGTDYMRFKADDDVGTNRKITLSSSVASSEDLTIQLGANDNTITFGSTTGANILALGTIGITAGSFNGNTIAAGAAAVVVEGAATGGVILGDSSPDSAGELGYAAGQLIFYDGTSAQNVAKAGTLVNTNWCSSDGTVINCNNAAPAGTGDFLANGTVPMTAAIVPNAANTIALGSAAAEWSDIYLGDGAVIYGQNDSTNTITSSSTVMGWLRSRVKVMERTRISRST
jgi:hypothetical protein